MEDCEKYLGLPMIGGKSKVISFKYLQEKITKRVMGWKEKFISKARREILIKTVAHAIPTYSIGIFKIPKVLCDYINFTLAKYSWAKQKMRRKSIGSIRRSCARLRVTIDMGFRGIQAFNITMLAKQAWILLHNTHSLFYQVYKSRYFPECSFVEAGLGNNPSYVWRSLLVARDIIKAGAY